MTLKELKDRRKGYTTAFGYCSIREDDLDWLIKQVDTLTAKAELFDEIVDVVEKSPDLGTESGLRFLLLQINCTVSKAEALQ